MSAGVRTSLAAALVIAGLAAVAGSAADPASAAYTAALQTGTLRLTGDASGDTLVLRARSGDPSRLEVDVGGDGTADFTFHRTTFTAIDVRAGGGDDTVLADSASGGLADEALTMSGGEGSDTLLGAVGAETLLGGPGDDVVAGGDGNDRALLGDGRDIFAWQPGDDSDTVDGEDEGDRLIFAGNAADERIELAAAGTRARLTRDVASVAMDLGGIERVDVQAEAGTDTVVAGDLTGTAVRLVDVSLGRTGAPDGAADTVIARGSGGADLVHVGSPAPGTVEVSGLTARTRVAGADAGHDRVLVTTLGGPDAIRARIGITGPAGVHVDGGADTDSLRYRGGADADQIAVAASGASVATTAAGSAPVFATGVEGVRVQGLDGADRVSAAGNLALLTLLTIDGGAGGDVLWGGNGGDVINGGDGADTVDGGPGADRVALGGGDDRFNWDPGDGNDAVEGQSGRDTVEFNGSSADERIHVTPRGQRARIARNLGSVVLDAGGTERLAVRARAGSDTVISGSLAGTPVASLDVDLGVPGGGADGRPDSVVVNGTSGPDVVAVTRSGGEVAVEGLSARVGITGSEPSLDALLVHTLGGDDDVTVADDVAGLIQTVVELDEDE